MSALTAVLKVRLDEATRKELDDLAEELDRPASSVARGIIRLYLAGDRKGSGALRGV